MTQETLWIKLYREWGGRHEHASDVTTCVWVHEGQPDIRMHIETRTASKVRIWVCDNLPGVRMRAAIGTQRTTLVLTHEDRRIEYVVDNEQCAVSAFKNMLKLWSTWT